MVRLSLIISSLIFIIACNNKTTDWLEHYKVLKCDYLTTEHQMNDSIQKSTAILLEEKNKIVESSKTFFSHYLHKIDILQSKIKQTGQEFQKEYNAETLKHSVKYGHVSTPEYEKRINQIEAKRDNAIAFYEKDISLIRTSMEADPQVRAAMDTLNGYNTLIKKKETEIKMTFKKKLDSLQQELNNHNAKYKQMVYELNQSEVNNLKAQRDSIKLHPCQ